MPLAGETLCVNRCSGKSLITTPVQTSPPWLSLPQHSLTHHHGEDPHWKFWLEIFTGTVLGTLPPPLPCICTVSAKPNLNSQYCKEELAYEFCNPNLSPGAKPFNPLASDSSENELNLEHPSKCWSSFLAVWVQRAILDIPPLKKAM